jgi:hypothetical protein
MLPETPCPSCGLTVTTDAHAVCPRCGEPLARPLPRLDPEAVRVALHKTGGRFRRPGGLRAGRARGDARPPAAA